MSKSDTKMKKKESIKWQENKMDECEKHATTKDRLMPWIRLKISNGATT